MPKTMEVHLPDEIAHYEGDLRYFFDSMMRKLYANRHKGFAEDANIDDLVVGHNAEVHELLAALKSEPQFNAFMETVDMANMAFLIGLCITRMTKDQYNGARK